MGLNDALSDQKLLRVLASSLLRSIIVTQPVVENYLNQLAHEHGLVLPPLHLIQGKNKGHSKRMQKEKVVYHS